MSNDLVLIESSGSSLFRLLFKEKYKFPPLGILSIAAFLKMHGYRVHIIDLMVEDYSKEAFTQKLISLCHDPLVVGISLYTDCYKEGIEIAAIARSAFPSTRIVMGGPHATFRASEVLSHNHIDFIVHNEGESTIIELLEHIKYPDWYGVENVASVSYRDENGTIISNSRRAFINNLDILPFPDYELLTSLRESYHDMLMFVSSRGCPGDCVYCSSRAMSGSRYRFNSAEWIFSLVYEYHKRYGFQRMVFLDDTFTVNRLRAKKFCRYLRQYWPRDSLPLWSCKSRADKVDDEICAEVARAGCLSIHIGVESADQNVLNAIAKHISLDQTFEAILSAARNGIRLECSLMIGHHADTLETIEKTIMLAQAIDDSGAGTTSVGISTPFPGTKLYENAHEFGIEITTHNWNKYNLINTIYHTKNFTENDLKKAWYFYERERLCGKKEIGLTDCDHKEFRQKLDWMTEEIKSINAALKKKKRRSDLEST